MGRKKPPVSTAELLARSSQNKAQAGGVSNQQDDCWEDDAALIAAEQDCKPVAPEADSAEALALREEQAEAAEALREAAYRRAENAKAAKEASKAAAKEAARVAKAAQEAVAEAMAAKKKAKKDAKKGTGKPVATPQSTYTASVPPSARAADPRAAAVAAAVAAKAAAQAGAAAGTLGAEAAAQRSRNAAAAAAAAAAGPLLEDVAAPSALHAQQPDELVEEWQAAAGGGFAPQLLGTHPGVSCDATGQCPLLGVRYQLRYEDTDLALHPHGYDVCGMAYARLSAAEQAKFDEIPPPCMAPIVYAAGSREHRTYVLMGLVSM